MFKKIIEKKVLSLTKNDIINFAIDNKISLTDSEIDIIYKYIKSDWETLIYSNHYIILNKIKNDLNISTYNKIDELINLYKEKYKNYL